VVNPRSGTKSASGRTDDIRSALSAAGLESHCILVEGGRNAADLAREAVQQGYSTVVASGGDGTVSGVASALVDTNVSLGVLPTGTLNHFAKDLQIPLDLTDAAKIISAGRTAAVDVAEVNRHTFINNSSLGVYPNMVIERENRRRGGLNKWIAQAAAIIKVLRRFPFIDVSIDTPDTLIVQHTPFVFIGNNNYEIQGLNIGSRPALNTGLLCVYVAAPVSRLRFVGMGAAALLGFADKLNALRSLSTTVCRIESRRRSVRVSVDGEVLRLEPPLHYRIRPGALKVIVP
jgi:diacylglycerol kinase family enzyme